MADVAPGIRDDLAAAIAEVEKEVPAGAETPAVETLETEVEQPEAAAEGRRRGPDGKFLPKDAQETPEQSAPEATEAKTVEEQPEQPKATTEAPPPAIARWSEPDKAMFKSLPKDAQEFILRRHGEMEADHTKKSQAIAELKREYEPVDQMFAPFKAQMQQQGWTPQTLIKAWAGVEQDLISGKGADVVARIVRDYRIDPQQIARTLGLTGAPAGQQQNQPAAVPEVDPAVDAVLQAKFGQLITPLQQQLQALTQESEARLRAQQLQQQRAAEQTVQSFIDAKLPTGDLAHPYYSEVENEMVILARALREQGVAPDLEKIYDQAVWANPSTREKLLTAQKAAQEAKAQEEARAKAAAAKKASSSVTGAPGSGLPPKTKSPESKSLRELLEEAAAENEAA